MTQRPKLLISVLQGMSYRNLVSSGLLDRLSEDFDVSLLTLSNHSALIAALKSTGSPVLLIDAGPLKKLREKILGVVELAQYLSFFDRTRTETMAKYVTRIRSEKSVKRFMAEILVWAGKWLKPGRFFEFPYLALVGQKLTPMLRKFDGLLVLSTDGVWDKTLTLAANRIRLPVAQMVHSWDNLPARGYLTGEASRLIVWNERMKGEAKALHFRDESRTDIVGVPQYDRYLAVAKSLDRESFLQSLGLGPNAKVIAYTCSAERVFPDEPLFVCWLQAFANRLGFTLVVRAHPTERISLYREKFTGASKEKLILDIPTGEFAASSRDLQIGNSKSIERFVGLMKYSSVVVNLASTISLDAILFGTPVICPAFNLDPGMTGAWNQASKWFHSTHFKPIKDSGAVSIADSPAGFEQALKRYVENPEHHETERMNLLDLFAPHLGKSHGEIAKALKAMFSANGLKR